MIGQYCRFFLGEKMSAAAGQMMKKSDNNIQVILFYKFVQLDSVKEFARNIETEISDRDLLGRILVAPDGINGTLAGRKVDVLEFEKYCVNHPVFLETYEIR